MKFKTIIILAVSYILFISCGDVPVFTEMDTNRLTVRIKGTFETESKSNFVPMSGLVLSGPLPTKFMFDIAEIRLNGDKFANYRQVMTADLTDTDPFFNGEGVVLDNDDLAPGYYDTVQVYVRKMIFDKAEIYGSSEPVQVVFNEEYVDGFDFNQYQQNTYVDSLKLNARDQLRSFPINIPIVGGLNYDKNDKETVLEIRFVIKNFIKQYKLPINVSGETKMYHFYALSDWLREVKDEDIIIGDIDFGGNILAVARAYVPGKTGSVRVNAGIDKYVIAIPKDEDTVDYVYCKSSATRAGVFPYDFPREPTGPGSGGIEALLDYYIRFENYKYKWNQSYISLPTPTPPDTDFSEYVNKWKAYDMAIDKFRIAPYVGYTGSSVYVEFKKMAPGEYNFYSVSYNPATLSLYGQLLGSAPTFSSAVGRIITDDKTPNLDITIP